MSAGAVALIGIVGGTIWLANVTATLGDEVVRARQVRIAAAAVQEALLDAETGQRGYLLTMDPAYLAPYTGARQRSQSALMQLSELVEVRADLRPKLAGAADLTEAKLAELEETVMLAQTGRREQALAVVVSDRGKQLMDQARAVLADIIATTEQSVTSNLNTLNADAGLLRILSPLGGLIVVAFAGAAILLLLRYIADAVRAQTEVARLNVTLEHRVEHRTAALARANDEIQRFAYIVSHDLRSPLVNIMGFTSELDLSGKALKTFFETNAENLRSAAIEAATTGIPEALAFIRTSTAKMDRLIGAILKLSREGRRELVPEEINLQRVFETVLASLKHQVDETHTEVQVDTNLPTVISDRLALEQIFSNLIDNALKYQQPGRPGHIAIEADTDRNSVVVKIRDNGRGIAEQDTERVFELFRRAGRQDRPGEGIGLAHVRALARRLAGDVTVSSRIGEGSEFRITLPRTLPPAINSD